MTGHMKWCCCYTLLVMMYCKLTVLFNLKHQKHERTVEEVLTKRAVHETCERYVFNSRPQKEGENLKPCYLPLEH